MPASAIAAGLRTSGLARCSTLTVFSLSVTKYAGHPPTCRGAASTAAATDGQVLPSSGMITRNCL